MSLVSPSGHVWLVPDGDAAGERFAQTFMLKVSPDRFVRWVKLEQDRQPTDWRRDEIEALFWQAGEE